MGGAMNDNPVLGVILHAIGGFAAGSFYIPFKRVKQWSWESYWLVGGVFSWIVAPQILAALTVENLWGALAASPGGSLLWTYLYGVLWGIGGLTFGLSMRYLGLSLGYALALGFCAAFGTLIPPLYFGQILDLLSRLSGQVTIAGVGVCLAGIAVCAVAGTRKEREMSGEAKRAAIAEFNFMKGLWVAIFAGVMSACMAFAFRSGEAIAAAAVAQGTSDIFKNNAVLVVVLAGGFTTNAIWCLYLNFTNDSWKDYFQAPDASLIVNYLFSALAGTTWYLQFFFYGMGTTKMGAYEFSSWTIHMAFIIVFSNLWGLFYHEWKGTSVVTRRWIHLGILILLLSTMVVGYGNYLAA